MNNPVILNIFRFIILIFIQVLVLNNIRIGGSVNPYLYVLFILLLPFETPGWLLLVSSFLLGLSVDLFSHTPGMNAAASVFMAFCRPAMIRFLMGSKSIEPGLEPGIKDMGFKWFFFYALSLVFVHHLVLFYIEIFRFNEFIQTLYRVLLSTIATIVLILLVEYLFVKKERKD